MGAQTTLVVPDAEPSALDLPFTALMSADAVAQLRASLDVAKNHDMMALYGFLVLDREAMIAMIKSVVAEDGADEAMLVLEAISNARENLAQVSRFAEMIEARAMITMHVALGLTLEDTASEPDADTLMHQAWDAAVADEARHRARMEALGDDYTDEAINEIAADWSPARDTLIGTAAPDLPALRTKFEVMWRPEEGVSGNPDAMDVGEFYKDLRRLAVAA